MNNFNTKNFTEAQLEIRDSNNLLDEELAILIEAAENDLTVLDVNFELKRAAMDHYGDEDPDALWADSADNYEFALFALKELTA